MPSSHARTRRVGTTSFCLDKDVDGRDKPGHDGGSRYGFSYDSVKHPHAA
jgi:hypothetical protein